MAISFSNRMGSNWGNARGLCSAGLGAGVLIAIPGRPNIRLKPRLLAANYTIPAGPFAGYTATQWQAGQGRVVLYHGTVDTGDFTPSSAMFPLFSTPGGGSGLSTGATPDGSPTGTELQNVPRIHIDKLLVDQGFTVSAGLMMPIPESEDLMTSPGGGLVALLCAANDNTGVDFSLGVIGNLTLLGESIDVASGGAAQRYGLR